MGHSGCKYCEHPGCIGLDWVSNNGPMSNPVQTAPPPSTTPTFSIRSESKQAADRNLRKDQLALRVSAFVSEHWTVLTTAAGRLW